MNADLQPPYNGIGLTGVSAFRENALQGLERIRPVPSLKSDMAYRSNPRAPPHPYREKCAFTGFTTHLPVSSGVICSFNGQHCSQKPRSVEDFRKARVTTVTKLSALRRYSTVFTRVSAVRKLNSIISIAMARRG